MHRPNPMIIQSDHDIFQQGMSFAEVRSVLGGGGTGMRQASGLSVSLQIRRAVGAPGAKRVWNSGPSGERAP